MRCLVITVDRGGSLSHISHLAEALIWHDLWGWEWEETEKTTLMEARRGCAVWWKSKREREGAECVIRFNGCDILGTSVWFLADENSATSFNLLIVGVVFSTIRCLLSSNTSWLLTTHSYHFKSSNKSEGGVDLFGITYTVTLGGTGGVTFVPGVLLRLIWAQSTLDGVEQHWVQIPIFPRRHLNDWRRQSGQGGKHSDTHRRTDLYVCTNVCVRSRVTYWNQQDCDTLGNGGPGSSGKGWGKEPCPCICTGPDSGCKAGREAQVHKVIYRVSDTLTLWIIYEQQTKQQAWPSTAGLLVIRTERIVQTSGEKCQKRG